MLSGKPAPTLVRSRRSSASVALGLNREGKATGMRCQDRSSRKPSMQRKGPVNC